MNVRTVSKQLKVPWFLAMSWSAHWAHSYGPHRCLVGPVGRSGDGLRTQTLDGPIPVVSKQIFEQRSNDRPILDPSSLILAGSQCSLQKCPKKIQTHLRCLAAAGGPAGTPPASPRPRPGTRRPRRRACTSLKGSFKKCRRMFCKK